MTGARAPPAFGMTGLLWSRRGGRHDLVDLRELIRGGLPFARRGVGLDLVRGRRAGDDRGAAGLGREAADGDLQKGRAVLRAPGDERLDLVQLLVGDQVRPRRDPA